MGSYLEYTRVPPQLVEPLVLAVLGSLHIRLSSLWGPASEALAAALEHAPDQAWPPVLAALAAAQGGFLTGADRGVPPEGMWVFSASPTSGCRDQQRDWCGVLPHRPALSGSRAAVGDHPTQDPAETTSCIVAVAHAVHQRQLLPASGLCRQAGHFRCYFLHTVRRADRVRWQRQDRLTLCQLPDAPPAMYEAKS